MGWIILNIALIMLYEEQYSGFLFSQVLEFAFCICYHLQGYSIHL